MKHLTFWDRLARAVRDRSFIIGAILVSTFILVAVLGPELAPHNPFNRDRIQTIDGELERAPFPPSELYPLGTDAQGRDMLSLLLHGARQTLVIAFGAMCVRMLLGLLLGTISGWWPGSLFDRAVTALTEFIAAIPGLILAVLLVYAVGIRRGQAAFIVALSLVGWGEVTQIVRGNVITIRKRLFILASRSLGLGNPQILSRHVLPNLLSTLLALAALEMGAVLLLQGELGFLHIFIGGGGTYLDESVREMIHYFEIPDWGAMLGTSWNYFRTLPWLPLAPAMAFFITILGFNLFGYGLQRFVEKGRFHPSGWSVLRFFAVVALVLWGAQALLATSSLESQFEETAHAFDVQRAWNDISYLAQPQLQGRASGYDGAYQAAGYIAQEFERAGLTPQPVDGYFQRFTTVQGEMTREPRLAVTGEDGSPELQFGLDQGLSFDPLTPFNLDHSLEGEIVLMCNVPDRHSVPMSVRGSDKIWLMLDSSESLPISYFAYHLGQFPFGAVLRMAPDEELGSGGLPSPGDPSDVEEFISLLVGESAVQQMFAGADVDFQEIQTAVESGEPIILPTGLRVQLEAGLSYEEAAGINVLGYFPAADITTQGDRILVVVPYTGVPPSGEEIYPGADEEASAVAVMLEVARLWHDQGFEPKRTVAFAALDSGGGSYLLNHPLLPTDFEDTWTVVILHGLGAGRAQLARLESSAGLGRALDESARRFGVGTEPLTEEWHVFFRGDDWTGRALSRDSYTGLVIARPGDDLSGTSQDTLAHLDPGLLSDAGKTVAHYLMVLSSH